MLPSRVVVVSFRFRPNRDDIHGGQDAFVHDLVRELRARGTAVDVITFRGRDDAEEAISDGARVHLLETPYSAELTAHEAHQRGTWRLLEVMESYSNAVERFLPKLRARIGGPLTILSHDIAEARWVRGARRAGDRIVTFGHVFFSEFALEDLTSAELERMHARAHFPLPLLTIGRMLLRRSDARQQLERAARVFRRPELLALLPGPARAALAGERSAFVDAHRVLLPARAMLEKVAAAYPRADADRALSVAPWGIGLSSATEDDVATLARKYAIDEGDRVLVTMSRLSPDKRIDALLTALKRVEEIAPALAKKTVVVLCGRPSFLEDHAYQRALIEQAKTLQHARVVFAGFQRGVDRTAHLRLGTRFVQIGRYEAFGLGIAEALSLGLPAITSDTDGAREILGSDTQAAHVVRGAPFEESLAHAIVTELGGARRDELRESAARRIGQRFAWGGTIDAISGAIGSISGTVRARATSRAE